MAEPDFKAENERLRAWIAKIGQCSGSAEITRYADLALVGWTVGEIEADDAEFLAARDANS